MAEDRDHSAFGFTFQHLIKQRKFKNEKKWTSIKILDAFDKIYYSYTNVLWCLLKSFNKIIRCPFVDLKSQTQLILDSGNCRIRRSMIFLQTWKASFPIVHILVICLQVSSYKRIVQCFFFQVLEGSVFKMIVIIWPTCLRDFV